MTKKLLEICPLLFPRSCFALLATVITLFPVACATVLTVDGLEVVDYEYRRMQEQVIPRAVIELKCAKEALSVKVIAARNRFIQQVAVEGCGKTAIYVDSNSGYVVNTVSVGSR